MGGDDSEQSIDASGMAQGDDAQDAIVGTGRAAARRIASPDAMPQQLAAQAQRRRLRARRPRSRSTCGADSPAWTQAGAASPAQQSGMHIEDQVCQYLQDQGARILMRNVQARQGEIDVVCLDDGVLAFVEVRQRSSARYGGAAASVGYGKQVRLIRTAQVWLPRVTARYFDGQTPPCRFDVVAVQGDAMEWLKQAFRIEG